MGDSCGAKRFFAVSAYARTRRGDFAGGRVVSRSLPAVSCRVAQADAALLGILDSLRRMRGICESCLGGGLSDEELAARNAELDALRGDVSRLSAAVAGTEFLVFTRFGAGAEDSLREIEESMDRVARMREEGAEDAPDSLYQWMRGLRLTKGG